MVYPPCWPKGEGYECESVDCVRRMSRALVFAAAAFAVVGTGAGVAAAESASDDVSIMCSLRIDVPNSGNDAQVGRANCGNTLDGKGTVVEDRNNWPDDTVGVTQGSGWGVKWVYGSCGNGEGTYYSAFESGSGASAQSSRVKRC